jgi:endoglucanase
MRSSIGVASAIAAALLAGCQSNVYVGGVRPGDSSLDATRGGDRNGSDGSAREAGPVFHYLHTSGSRIVDDAGNEVRLRCINWSGFETYLRVPDGLHARTYHSLIGLVASLGFNCIRFPYCNDALRPESIPGNVDAGVSPLAANAELMGLTSLAILDKLLADAEEQGLYVLLARHAPKQDVLQYPLWATDQATDQQWIDDWSTLAQRSLLHPSLVGFDLHDGPGGAEPDVAATWGTGDPSTDWALAATRAANAVFAINRNLLIIVAGVETVNGQRYWPGGNLSAALDHPLVLARAGQLVYAAQDYGSGKMFQSWFSDAMYAENLPTVWDAFWGYLLNDDVAPVFVGAFGDRGDADLVPDTEKRIDDLWLSALVSYLNAHRASFGFWALNRSAQGLTGLLQPGWLAVNEAQLARIQPLLPAAADAMSE